MESCIRENAHVAQSQTDYQENYETLSANYDSIKKRLEEVSEKIRERREKRERIEAFLKEIETLTPGVTEFTEDLWLNLLDHMTVYSEDDIRFTFKDGTEIKV